MTTFTSDQWVILALVFVLGLLIGAFLSAGGRRKWKTRYREETDRRAALEREHGERETHFADREKEWREQDSLRAAAIKSPRDPEIDRRVEDDRRVEEDRRRAPRREDDPPL